jgi:hypothetical protein
MIWKIVADLERIVYGLILIVAAFYGLGVACWFGVIIAARLIG